MTLYSLFLVVCLGMKRYRSIIFRMKQRKNEEWKPEINIYS